MFTDQMLYSWMTTNTSKIGIVLLIFTDANDDTVLWWKQQLESVFKYYITDRNPTTNEPFNEFFNNLGTVLIRDTIGHPMINLEGRRTERTYQPEIVYSALTIPVETFRSANKDKTWVENVLRAVTTLPINFCCNC